MSFHSPYILWLLVPLVLLFSWELARHASRTAAESWPKIARAWAGAFAVSLGTRHTTAETRPRLWLWFGLAFCLVALARPQWGVIEEQVFDQSREVLIAVDLSKSMLAQDVKPSRLDRAKLLIQSLLDRLRGERVGLVLFSGSAFLQSPLSADYEILREFLPALQPDYLPEGGSNYRGMLEAAIEAFGTSTADRYLIILSDGESTEEGWKELSASLREKGIRIIGLGIGTTAGAFIPDEAGGFVKDERGAVVMSRLNSSTLQELAQVSGGAYADASAWVDLPALLARTVESGRKGEFSEKNTARLVERFQWFLAPGLLLLLISFWAEFPVRPRERALPLAGRGMRSAERGVLAPTTSATAMLVILFWLSALSAPRSAPAQAAPVDTAALALPLSTAVTRLAVKDQLTAKDFSELAQTTVTYGQRMKSAQQPPVEGALRDALTAVDRGEKLDPKAADWPKLRRELEELLQKEEPPPQDQQQQEQQDQEEEKKDEQQQDKSNQDQQKQDQQQSPSDQEQKQEPNQDPQSAFGDMEEKAEPPKQEPKPQPQSGTQKVGGQQEEKQSEAQQNPELALPLQKLDQVRDQDSPAKLYQLLQGRKEEPKKKGKDW